MDLLIIEDEMPAAERLKKLVKQVKPQARCLGPLDSIEDSVAWLRSHSAPDLILCDIHLADGMSFDIFEQVDTSAPIIFTTAYDQYAIRAFKLNSVDYLLKPIDPEELRRSLQKRDRWHNPTSPEYGSLDVRQLKKMLAATTGPWKTRFLVRSGDIIKSISVQEIARFSSEDKVTLLHTRDAKARIVDYTLTELEEMLDPDYFFRLNRKCIASIDSVEKITVYSGSRLSVQLKDAKGGEEIVSRDRVTEFRKWMGQ
ncbi:LytTR family DNA-binding domain-containing protein [Balneolales bacterium ANBcel1]|nr:LytTR family DNA-binding domain-containing protein [Balneolales bacterium ANBcel1]